MVQARCLFLLIGDDNDLDSNDDDHDSMSCKNKNINELVKYSHLYTKNVRGGGREGWSNWKLGIEN